MPTEAVPTTWGTRTAIRRRLFLSVQLRSSAESEKKNDVLTGPLQQSCHMTGFPVKVLSMSTSPN